MKRVYKKPMILQENFVLSENIAACDAAFGNGTNISIDDLKFAGYLTDNSCRTVLTEMYEFTYNGLQLCYHTSTGVNVFSS